MDNRRFFLVWTSDKAGMLMLRETLRPAHRQWLREHPGHDVTVIHGGATLDAGRRMNGTLLVIEATSADRVERFVAADPYTKGGLFAQIVVREWQWSLGKPAGPTGPPVDYPPSDLSPLMS